MDHKYIAKVLTQVELSCDKIKILNSKVTNRPNQPLYPWPDLILFWSGLNSAEANINTAVAQIVSIL